jgi:tetratricopeptide (TPR) repeat protein
VKVRSSLFTARFAPALVVLVVTATTVPVLFPRTAAAGRADNDQVAALRSALEKGDIEAAVAKAEETAATDPKDAEVLLWLGRVYGMKAQKASLFSKLSWAKKCRTSWEKAAVLDPANAEVQFELTRYFIVAPGIAGGSVEKATEQAAKLMLLDPVQGWITRGMIADHEKKPADAELAYKKAMETDTKGVQGTIALAGWYARQNRWDDARAIFDKKLAANPQDTFSMYQLGRLALLSGQNLEKGVSYFDRFLMAPAPKDGPTWADARWRKGLILEKLGKTPEAIAEYREALKLNPGHSGVKKELERLKVS